MERRHRTSGQREFFEALRNGILLGAGVLLIVLPPAHQATSSPSVSSPPTTSAPADVVQASVPPQAPRPAMQSAVAVHRYPQFGSERASADVMHVANWAFYTGDHQGHSVVIIDKKQAKAFVFAPDGELAGAAPVLLGSQVGDYTVPGVGDKPIAQVRPDERTTPAGRFVAEIGNNANGEDVVWVDYDAAVSMHRVRATVKSERRLERLASVTPADNRISFGCINMPPRFFEQVLKPAVEQAGAIVYVLPETRSADEVLGSHEVPDALMALVNLSR